MFNFFHLAAFLGGVLLSVPTTAHANASEDPYGRLATETTLTLGLGAGAQLTENQSFLSLVDLRWRYLESVGVVLNPELRASGDVAFHLGIEVRPLFWWRFLQGRQVGTRFVDEWIDSIGFEMGASYIREDSASKPGWMLGLGCDLPFWHFREPQAVFLHVGLRYVHSLASDYGGSSQDFQDLSAYVTLNTKWAL